MGSITRAGIGFLTAVALCACGTTEGGDALSGESVAVSVDALEELDDRAQLAHDEAVRQLAVPQTGPDGATTWVLPAPDLIAHFTTADGRTAEYKWSSLTDELIYVEMIAAGQAPLFADDVSLLERYLLLAPEGADVPRAIVAHDDSDDQATLLAGRDVVPAVAPMTVSPDRLAVLPVLAVTASCGSTAAAHFAANHCWYLNNNTIAPNRHDPLWCCDENGTPAGNAYDTSSTSTGCLNNSGSGNSMWTTLFRKNSAKRWNSYNRTAACGAPVLVEHLYQDAFGDWNILNNGAVNVADGSVAAIFRKGGAKRYRQIRNISLGSSGGLRAYSEFSNNF